MEKIKKPTKSIFRLLCFLVICFTTLILTPICIYSYFHNFNKTTPVSHGNRVEGGPPFGDWGSGVDTVSQVDADTDSWDTNPYLTTNNNSSINPVTSGQDFFHTKADSFDSGATLEKNRLLETIRRDNVATLRRELIYIYKLPPVSDQDYENEEKLHLSHKHGNGLGGARIFDDLDTDDYPTDDNSIKSQTSQTLLPHRFGQIIHTTHHHSPNKTSHLNVIPSATLPKVYASPQSPTTLIRKSQIDSVSHGELTPSGIWSPPSPSSLPMQTHANLLLPIVQKGNENKSRMGRVGGEGGEGKVKFYDTGHFRKSHAIIWDAHPQYIFHAFAHRFHLMLNLIPQKHSFIAPHLAVTTHSVGRDFVNESFVWRENLRGKISGCFYNGYVLGDPASSVAVSLCHGMTGHIRTSHGSYFIEPLPPTSKEVLERKIKEKLYSIQNNNSAGDANDYNDDQEILHQIYQVGLDLTKTEGKQSDEEDPNTEEYSYDSLDNLEIGALPQNYEDEEDMRWLNPGINISKAQTHNKNKSSDSKVKSRVKRSESIERYVELAVITDSSMSSYHGDNLRHYVLTILSIVALIYKDASIGNPINIALVSFHVLPNTSFATNKWGSENNTSNDSTSGISASEMLRNFCKWQKAHNPDESRPEHWDTALLLTRETICRNPWLQKCDTLGLAELGTMCDSYASCAIVQDNGLSAAFTIAHELGHVMNMPHDDDYKCQSFLEAQKIHPGSNHHIHQQFTFTSDSPNAVKEPQHYVMSRMLDHNTYPWAWSRCSRHFLTEWLDSPSAEHGKCLEDMPGSNLLIGDSDNPDASNFLEKPQQPGEIFSEHKQCELVFGPSSKLCTYMPSCKRLWCTSPASSEEQEGCRTQHNPWADGTACGSGSNNWCQRGACVKKDLTKLKTVDGGWGSWMEFGECSRTCGGGIMKSYRECDNPRPSNGGKYCIGPRVQYKSCNTFECPNEVDYRAEQCSNFNNDNFNIQGLPKNITWVPKYHGLSPKDQCKLFCRVQGSSSYYLLREKVIDGTPCAHDTFDVCVNGGCLAAGCDRRLHSKKSLDVCGVCGGDARTCRTVRGSFNETKYGYNPIIRIPPGASNIDIRQRSVDDTARDDNYLALLDSNDEFILNGQFVVSMFRKTLHYGGSLVEYSGSDEVVERINSSSRPIKSELVLQVLSVGKLNPPNVVYQYVISLNYNAESASSNGSADARWVLADRWTSCSDNCQGTQTQIQMCSNIRTGSEISSDYCRHLHRLEDVTKACNTHCTIRWYKSQKQCDCVNPSRTEVSVKCVREASGNKSYISDGYCSRLEKPEATADCSAECSRPKWRYTQWSECSSRCGDGIQNRRVYCQKYNINKTSNRGGQGSDREVHDNYVYLPDSECTLDGTKPTNRQKCNSGACGQWKVADWTPCSATCGQGRSQAAYACYLEDVVLPSDFCKGQTQPLLERPCEAERPCVEWAIMISNDNFVTELNEMDYWSECTERCSPSTGHRTRPLVCVIRQGNRRMKQVNENLCSRYLSNKPPSQKSCDDTLPSDCFFTNQHQKGLEVFGHQRQTQNDVDTLNTIEGAMSLPLRSENAIVKDIDWITGPWSVCFKSGTNAIQIREVSCPTDNCRGTRPMNSRACGVWFTGEWGACNSTCENRIGQEIREVKCIQSDRERSYSTTELEESDCLAPKPDKSRNCTLYCKSRGRWRTGPWGKCSRPCGIVQNMDVNGTKGQRMRQVICVEESKPLKVLPDTECENKNKPELTSACMDTDNKPCPVWSVSDWSECMATTTTAATIINPKFHQKKERSVRKKPELCSNEINQNLLGHRERLVKCHDQNGHEIPEIQCALLKKRPEYTEVCVLSRKHCVQNSIYRWRVGNWTLCSKNCGTKGIKTRSVECTKVGIIAKINNTIVVDDKFCQKGGRKIKPKAERGCARFHCQFKWVVTDWTECDRPCGGYGLQKRQVTCHRINRLGWVDPDPVNGCEAIEEKPKEYNYCMISESCSNTTVSISYAWKTEEWSECPSPPQTCEKKDRKLLQKRRVYCTMNGIRTPQRHCDKLGVKPERRRRCPKITCGWRNCVDVKQVGNRYDGEYQMTVGGSNVSIYCHGMSSDHPKEYLTLWEESISEIYDKRLIRPESCPRNGERLESCECVKDSNRRSGLTTWTKIRLNVTNLRVDREDYTFAKSTGDLIPFGTSGDCYSSAMNCPQGRFSIDLRRTRLAVNPLTTWTSHGQAATMQITKSSNNQRIEGKCGGYCGSCSPTHTGLKLEILHS